MKESSRAMFTPNKSDKEIRVCRKFCKEVGISK